MKRKPDICIGQRCVEELYRLFPNESDRRICRIIGCNKNSIEAWRNGAAPSSMFLAAILNHGGDLEYILTGRRTTQQAPDFLAEYEEEYN